MFKIIRIYFTAYIIIIVDALFHEFATVIERTILSLNNRFWLGIVCYEFAGKL